MKFINIISILVFISSSFAEASSINPKTLRVALIPDENAAKIIKKHKGFREYLAKALNKRIRLVVSTDYSSMIEAMRHGRLELAYFGPLSYVMAKSKSQIEVFAARKKDGRKTYQTAFIVNRDFGINKIEDVKGKNMAFGDIASTSSHLIPKSMLRAKGLVAKDDYEEHFLGAHDAVAVAVQNGKAQAGALSRPIFESLVKRGIISLRKVKVLEYSKPFPQYPWVMRSDLDLELKKNIRTTFYNLRDKSVLGPFKASGFAEMEDEDYDGIRELSKILKLKLTF
tara:strand:+ start:2280 stop:3128 length:849 start_codon:yes stop_codon:yes gene_type:complete